MKLLYTLLPFVAVGHAVVIPSEEVVRQIAFEFHDESPRITAEWTDMDLIRKTCSRKHGNPLTTWTRKAKSTVDGLLEHFSELFHPRISSLEEEYFDTKSWLASKTNIGLEEPHHPPHRRPPPHGKPPHDKPPHHGPPHRHPPGKGRHPHHGHHKSNKTVYELIAESKYTTKLAKLINEDKDLIDLLNGTSANFTVFAPTDKAFDKIPKKAPKPSKEFIKKLLKYHVSSEAYTGQDVFFSHTIPTLLGGDYLSNTPEDTPQRLAVRLGLRGLTINFYSKIVAANIFGSNGVIHGIDSILVPPPNAAEIINFFPGAFSTLQLGLLKTGLADGLNDTSNHLGGTIFAPNNFAFEKLGPKINGFLFSKYGEKYLKALLQYHIVANQTLYSDAFYKVEAAEEEESEGRGIAHVDLPTLLKDRYLSIDIARWGRFIEIRINGFRSVAVQDGIAKDGVIHVVTSVLIPPKKLGNGLVPWDGKELTVEDFKERLEPYVEGTSESQVEIDLEL